MIQRDAVAAASENYDLIIVGGGIYGATLALESSRRGLKALLLDRGDFGNATTWHSLRFVHGGFRYLRTLDVRRLRESSNERRWFLRNFPDLVHPTPVRLLLQGHGLHRPSLLTAAGIVNDMLTWDRNRDVDIACHVPRVHVDSATTTRAAVPSLPVSQATRSVVWHDGVMIDSARLLIEILRWATAAGARCLNYADVTNLIHDKGAVRGVRALDVHDDGHLEFLAPVVVNCAGPWAAELSKQWGHPNTELFHPSLALNLHLDIPAPCNSALAVPATENGGGIFVIRPWHGGTLAGTFHTVWTSHPPHRDGPEVGAFLHALNRALPSLAINPSHVRGLLWGQLPVTQNGGTHLRVRDLIYDHGQTQNSRGLYSVSGVKFTTARRIAERMIQTICMSQAKSLPAPREVARPSRNPWPCPTALDRSLNRLAIAEAAPHLDDIFLRRTEWWAHLRHDATLPDRVVDALGWDDHQRKSEKSRLQTAMNRLSGTY